MPHREQTMCTWRKNVSVSCKRAVSRSCCVHFPPFQGHSCKVTAAFHLIRFCQASARFSFQITRSYREKQLTLLQRRLKQNHFFINCTSRRKSELMTTRSYMLFNMASRLFKSVVENMTSVNTHYTDTINRQYTADTDFVDKNQALGYLC